MNPFNPTTSFKWVCGCSPAFSCACVRDIIRKQVLTLTLNQPRKVLSSFHIREVGIILTIINNKESHKLLLVSRMTTPSVVHPRPKIYRPWETWKARKEKSESNNQIHPSFTYQIDHGEEEIELLHINDLRGKKTISRQVPTEKTKGDSPWSEETPFFPNQRRVGSFINWNSTHHQWFSPSKKLKVQHSQRFKILTLLRRSGNHQTTVATTTTE